MFELGVSRIIYLWAHIICTLALIQLAVLQDRFPPHAVLRLRDGEKTLFEMCSVSKYIPDLRHDSYVHSTFLKLVSYRSFNSPVTKGLGETL
jgi:hypothetical protein